MSRRRTSWTRLTALTSSLALATLGTAGCQVIAGIEDLPSQDAGPDAPKDGSPAVDAGGDARTPDASSADATSVDAGAPDATLPPDAGGPDATLPPDSGRSDAAATPDAGFLDATLPSDGGAPDAAAPLDSGSSDAPPLPDAGPSDAAAPLDAGVTDATTSDAGPPDATAKLDAGATDATVATDAALTDAGSVNAPEASTPDTGTVATTDAALPPSCAPGGPGMTNCGPDGGESCCTSYLVDGGIFFRTYTNTGAGPVDAGDLATISSFKLDKYLVTVGRFRQFVNAWTGGWRPTPGTGKHTHLNDGGGLASEQAGHLEPGWQLSSSTTVASGLDPTSANLASCGNQFYSWEDDAGGPQENQPINCISWEEAYAFCIWDGAFVPSEAEWIYAAAGGAQQRQYPWGTDDPGIGTSYAIFAKIYQDKSSTAEWISPVGWADAGVGLWGQLDLAGNVKEWVLDYYHGNAFMSPCSDCAWSRTPDARLLRGSSFRVPTSDDLQTWYPSSPGNGSRDPDYGVRCARTP